MQALLDVTPSSREALQQAVVFHTLSVTGRVLFPVRHAEAASSEAVSVLWVGAPCCHHRTVQDFGGLDGLGLQQLGLMQSPVDQRKRY